MADIIEFPLEKRVDRWARWERALVNEYYRRSASIGRDASEVHARLVVSAWRISPEVAVFEAPEFNALKFIGWVPPETPAKATAKLIVAWLDERGR